MLLIIELDIIKQDGIYKKASLYIRFTNVDARFIEKNENKYLVLALTKNNKKEVLKSYKRLWSWIEKQT